MCGLCYRAAKSADTAGSGRLFLLDRVLAVNRSGSRKPLWLEDVSV
jgi:hypothetical protein